MSLSGIWLPESAREGDPQGDGRFRCKLCEATFHDPIVWERHVSGCAQRSLDEIRARSPRVRNKGGPFDPETWDPDEERHMRKVGERMLRDGDFEVKRNERAGAGGGGVL